MATIRLEMTSIMDGLRPWFDESRPYLDYRPHDGGWSVRLILEHVMLTSHYLLILVDKASAKAQHRALQLPVTTDWSRYELFPDKLASIGVHKSFPWIRPDHMEPTGKISLNEIQHKISGQFARCEDHLRALAHGEGSLCVTTMTVNDIGKLDVYQYIYFLVLHARRHLAQLEETKDEFNREYTKQ